MPAVKTALFITTILLLSGCMSTKSYVDPSFGKARYDDIIAITDKYPVSLDVEYQKNGEPFEAGERQARSLVKSTLWTTGVFDFNGGASGASLRVVVNNSTNKSTTAAKGFGTALTLGAVGSTVTDYYEFSIAYVDAAGKPLQLQYKHAMHTTVGNKKPFENAQPTSPTLGFATIVEEVMLNFVKDMQSQGLLTNKR